MEKYVLSNICLFVDTISSKIKVAKRRYEKIKYINQS